MFPTSHYESKRYFVVIDQGLKSYFILHCRALIRCRQPEISPAIKPFSPLISGYSRPELTQKNINKTSLMPTYNKKKLHTQQVLSPFTECGCPATHKRQTAYPYSPFTESMESGALTQFQNHVLCALQTCITAVHTTQYTHQLHDRATGNMKRSGTILSFFKKKKRGKTSTTNHMCIWYLLVHKTSVVY